ncbi:Allergen Fus c 3 [Fusarium oxysporum f. sp. albedinis]|nr:Allergen Fus c 3 [Fusarium oxysporum f. sp. albedinis]
MFKLTKLLRSLSLTFGRPCAIPEEYIRLDLPKTLPVPETQTTQPTQRTTYIDDHLKSEFSLGISFSPRKQSFYPSRTRPRSCSCPVPVGLIDEIFATCPTNYSHPFSSSASSLARPRNDAIDSLAPASLLALLSTLICVGTNRGSRSSIILACIHERSTRHIPIMSTSRRLRRGPFERGGDIELGYPANMRWGPEYRCLLEPSFVATPRTRPSGTQESQKTSSSLAWS